MVAAVVVAAVVAAAGLFAFAQISWPAFPSSNVLQAVTTAAQVVTLAVLAFVVWWIRRSRRLGRRAGWWPKPLAWASLSGFVTASLGLPLAATTLYLHGVSVDQEFRTQYLTRLTDSAALRDMTYADLPPYYPAGWFWLGGRVASVLGLDGWEAFKPYSIGSIAVAAVVALVLWMRLVRTDLGVLAAVATTAVTVTFASPEAYGAVVIVVAIPALVLAWGALRRPPGRGGWGAVVGTGLFLGAAATVYTLYLGWAAFTVVVMGLIAAILAYRSGTRRDALEPLLRVAVIAAVSGLVALTAWLPYLVAVVGGTPAESGTALHYLPEAAATLPLPMVDFSLTGALCLIGTLWLVTRAATSRRAQALGLGVVTVYAWYLLSMVATVLGTTLLAFRLEPVLLALLAAAGAFGVVEFGRWILLATSESPRVRASIVAIVAVCAVAFVQDVPKFLGTDIAIAYSDTDGNGERADRRPPSSVAYYDDVDAAIRESTGRPADDTVVLTGDTSLMSFHPYWGFLGRTSHYANPLAEYDARREAVHSWAESESADELLDALAGAPWRAPDVFVLRESADGYTLRLGEDVYPNDPNVRMYQVTFPAALFDDPRFDVQKVGPFVVAAVR
ncbi:arabinofuranosyltransferase [Rhodococcus rhodnii]|uniref:Galactan 5-O-arabinofuranosyltransferase n=1 Tax=Rhodococcus rhodnii TaxID=38312 RepID=A0A6P2CKI2_9NOCA|nr:arabinofuranosyltransferase [Rhodococcus rhodnii]